MKTSRTESEVRDGITGDFGTDTDTWDEGDVLDFSVEGSVDFGVGPAGLQSVSEEREGVCESQH